MAINIQPNTAENRQRFAEAFYPMFGSSWANRVARDGNEGQFGRLMSDTQSMLDRNIERASQSVARIENARVNAEEGGVNEEGKPLVDLEGVTQENADQIKDLLGSLEASINKIGEFVTPDVIDQFNSMASIASDSTGGDVQFNQIGGGSGQAVFTIDNIKSAATGTTDLQGNQLDSRTGAPGEPVRPTMDDFRHIEDGRERNRAFTTALNEFLGRNVSVGSGQVDGGVSGGVDGGTSGGDSVLGPNEFQTGMQDALDIINNSGLPDDLKALYRTVVENWDPDTELNPGAIIDKFQEIKESTIDPHFQGLANLAIDQVKSSRAFMDDERARELEAQGISATESISGAQKGLEASGLTTSGEAIKQLGSESAVPFGGATQVEGLVPTQNRLIATSTEARFKEQQRQLARQAESSLGSTGAEELQFDTLGSVTGDLPASRQAQEAQTLTGLISQQTQTKQQGENLDFSP